MIDAATSSFPSQSGIAHLVFAKGDIEKTLDGTSSSWTSCWGSNWKISGSFATPGRIQINDYIKITKG